jgi:hypothetical protein
MACGLRLLHASRFCASEAQSFESLPLPLMQLPDLQRDDPLDHEDLIDVICVLEGLHAEDIEDIDDIEHDRAMAFCLCHSSRNPSAPTLRRRRSNQYGEARFDSTCFAEYALRSGEALARWRKRTNDAGRSSCVDDIVLSLM